MSIRKDRNNSKSGKKNRSMEIEERESQGRISEENKAHIANGRTKIRGRRIETVQSNMVDEAESCGMRH